MEKLTTEKTDTRRAKIDDIVLIQYTARLEDGSIVGSNKNKKPVKVTLGEDKVHPILMNRITGMVEGESKKVTIPASKAYGTYQKDLMYTVDKDKFAKDPQIGDHYRVRLKKGDPIKVRVTKVNNLKVTLDANHSLAGKDITYEITLEKIIPS